MHKKCSQKAENRENWPKLSKMAIKLVLYNKKANNYMIQCYNSILYNENRKAGFAVSRDKNAQTRTLPGFARVEIEVY